MLKIMPRALAWGFSFYIINKFLLACCGRDVQKAQQFSVFQSDLAWSMDDPQSRIVARANVQLNTRFGNLRLTAGAHSDIPAHIAQDLIEHEAPIWVL